MEAGLRDAQPAGQYLHGALAAKNEAGAEGAFRSWLPWPLSAAAGAASAQANGYTPALPNGAGPSAYPQANGASYAPHYMPYANGGYANGFGGAGMGGGGAHAAAEEEAAPGEAGAVRRSAREPKSRIILVRCSICVASRCQHAHQICRHICVDAGCSALHCLAGGQASSILQGWARLSRRHGMHSLMVLCHEPAADRWHPLPEG